MNDIELTQRALEGCGYRVKLRERAGTQWVEACKAPQVRYAHWHPLSNIGQAMQLLIDAPSWIDTRVDIDGGYSGDVFAPATDMMKPTAQDLINAQCRAIVTAIAGLKA